LPRATRPGDPYAGSVPHVVAEPCIRCKYTDCVEVCPVECFYEGENFLAIDPVECIDCGACVPECPTEAIFVEENLPRKWRRYAELNARLAALWPRISERKEPLPDAEAWKGVTGKAGELSEEPGA